MDTHLNGNRHAEHNGTNGVSKKTDVMPIAVIGMGSKFPGASDSPESLWKLISKGKTAWSEIPKNRFSAESFYHPDPDHHGTSNTLSGHFLEDDLACFDAPFFGITPNEAKAIDPQQRLLLESTYEALESAGISIEQISGSKTSVYVGVFNQDYKEMMAHDHDASPQYQATGNGQSILSNRISYFFNLKGPSVSVDTACSSGLVSLHLAVQSLQTGEAEQALVGASNLILGPNIMISLSMLGFLSQDGKAHTFDHRASGYARGEGIATLVLKPLHKALIDGDPIRAVIRSTGVNSDGRTAGITLPNGDAQASLIREVYAKAQLDPVDTAYFEAHGTGTHAGDPIEVEAIHDVFTVNGKRKNPLYIGSIKPNIGHVENTSGLAGMVKTILCLEKGFLAPNLYFEKPNARIDMDGWNLKVPTELMPWPAGYLRRASVNSFGYGGTNAHVILDGPDSAQAHVGRVSEGSDGRSRVFVLSASHPDSSSNMAKRLAVYLRELSDATKPNILPSLAHTLADRRSRLAHRLAVVASSAEELIDALDSDVHKVSMATRSPHLGLVFSGQGAQWAGMAAELMGQYPVFSESLQHSNKALEGLGCLWNLVDELQKKEDCSHVNEPLYSQTLCTAVQLALVDLLWSWNVKPAAVTGFSSGEIAAAYAAGALSRETAMAVAYYRGTTSAQLAEDDKITGRMAAVGLSQEKTEAYVAKVQSGTLCIACLNGPESMTVSGDAVALDEFEGLLKKEDSTIFFRRLRVTVAYHSHHMQNIAEDYRTALHGLPRTKVAVSSWTEGVQFYSTVTGSMLPVDRLDWDYWVKNFVSPVQFHSSLHKMCLGLGADGKKTTHGDSLNVQMLLEVGPHSVLAGPIKSILRDSSFGSKTKIPYASCLVRHQDAVRSMQKAAGSLFSHGCAVSLSEVNERGTDGLRPAVLDDLPSYAWNHEQRYWHETRMSKNYRLRSQPRKDLVGAPVTDWNPIEPRWRGYIRPSELPWVRDHRVQGKIVYPAAGMISMAVEAMRQVVGADTAVTGFELRDVQFGKAIMIDEEEGIDHDTEVTFVLRPWNSSSVQSSKLWHEFRLFTAKTSGDWDEHCRGCISAKTPAASAELGSAREEAFAAEAVRKRMTQLREKCTTVVNVERLYNQLDTVGIHYEPTFQTLTEVRRGPDLRVLAQLTVTNTASLMPHGFEHDHLLHPTTLDGAFQTIFSAKSSLSSAIVPTSIKHMTVANRPCNTPGQTLTVALSAERKGFRQMDGDLTVVETEVATDSPMVEIQGMRFVALADSTEKSTAGDRKLCFNTVWDDDLDLLSPSEVSSVFPPFLRDEETSSRIQNMETVAFQFMKKTVETLKDEDREKMSSHHQLFYDSMKNVCQKAAQKDIYSDEQHASLVKEVTAYGAEGEMICRLGQKLVPILRQEADPLELMLEDGLLYDLYRTVMGNDNCYAYMSRIMEKLSHKQPNMHVLEIGAGTGGATLPILEALGGQDDGSSPRFAHYDFTDISTGFFEKAQENFQAWEPLVSFQRLDIEDSPGMLEDQGFTPGKYDVIIAANVLHATQTMRKTMQNVRRLLRPGGKLILMELTTRRLRTQVIFGNLPGWWLGASEGRTMGPTLTMDAWATLLRETGFSGLDISLQDFPDAEDCLSSVIVSTAVAEVPQKTVYPPVVILDSFGCESVALKPLMQGLKALTSVQPIVASLQTCACIDMSDKVCLCLDELTQPLLLHMDKDQFNQLQHVIFASKGLLWTTRGAAPDASLMEGVARTILTEDTTRSLVTLDLDDEVVSDAAATILRVFQHVFRPKNSGDKTSKPDWEFRERRGRLRIPRIVEDRVSNAFISRETQEPTVALQPFCRPGRPLKLEIGSPGLLDSLRFVDDEAIQQPIGDDEVDIRVAASGLNFHDIMVAVGQIDNFLGCECSGVIEQVGRNVSHLKPGDRVCAWSLSAYGTFVRNPAALVQLIPDDMAFEVAASLPVVYCTAYLSLCDSARLQPGETVLIHTASGGVGQAAIVLAQMIGAEVYATVGSLEKRRFLTDTYGIPDDHIFSSRDRSFSAGIRRMTAGKGVDVALNSLAGELLQETWNCMAMFGRFVEIGKRDILTNARLDMTPFIRYVTFSSVDMTAIYHHRRALGSESLRTIMELFRQHKIRAVKPITSYPVSQIEDAFRFMQAGKHLGKVVITAADNDMVKVLPKQDESLKFPADASYLLVGGLGGLGRATSAWMAEHGAKNFMFVSRSGTAKPEAASLVKRLRSSGACVAILQCDVCDYEKLSGAVHEALKSMPPIRGIIHGAMVIRDCIFEAMPYDQFQDSLRPKVYGTQNLHRLTADMPLDFFIILSSGAGIVGNASEANYAAGGTFQDAFAHYRTAHSQPAVALDLGSIDDIGFVAENQEYVRNLRRWGYMSVSQKEFLSMLKQAILYPNRSQETCQVISGLGTGDTLGSRTTDDDLLWFQKARFSHLLQMGRRHAHETGTDRKIGLDQSLPAAESVGEATHIVCEAIKSKMSKLLGIVADNIDTSQPMSAYGLDSLVAVELRNWLFHEAKADLAVFEVLGNSPLMTLAGDITLRSKILPAELRKTEE